MHTPEHCLSMTCDALDEAKREAARHWEALNDARRDNLILKRDLDRQLEWGNKIQAHVAGMEAGIHPAKKPMEGGFSLDKFMPNTDPETARALGEMLDAMEVKRKLNGWTKCAERMPEPRTKVLVLRESQILTTAWWLGSHWDVDGASCVAPGDVTHWMSLPSPPEH